MRILIIRQCALGDLIITIPTFELFRKYFPDAYIEVLGNMDVLELIRAEGYLDSITPARSKLITRLYMKDSELPQEIGSYFGSFDIVAAYAMDEEGIVESNILKAGAGRFIKINPFPSGDNIHVADFSAGILDKLDLAYSTPLYPQLTPLKSDLEYCANMLAQFGNPRPLIAIHPRTYGKKAWPIESFIRVGDWVERTLNGKALWILGPWENENLSLIKDRFPDSPILDSKPLTTIAAGISLTNHYFGCDTGLSHLAAAVGTPTLALFGPTDPNVWSPRGKNVTILQNEGLADITPEAVCELLDETLKSGDEGERILDYSQLIGESYAHHAV